MCPEFAGNRERPQRLSDAARRRQQAGLDIAEVCGGFIQNCRSDRQDQADSPRIAKNGTRRQFHRERRRTSEASAQLQMCCRAQDAANRVSIRASVAAFTSTSDLITPAFCKARPASSTVWRVAPVMPLFE